MARVGKPLEMARSGKRTFCCGAGGAHMWMEERGNQINEERAREAAETGATTLAVACPFCTIMLDDGVKQNGSEFRVADVATLLAEALRRTSPGDPLTPGRCGSRSQSNTKLPGGSSGHGSCSSAVRSARACGDHSARV